MADKIKDLSENTEEVISEAAVEAEEKADEVSEKTAEAAEKIENASADEDDIDKKAEEKESKIVDDILEIIESTLVTVFVIVMIFTYLLHPVNVVGRSMNNTLMDNDRIFMTTIYGGPHYGDIIVINNDEAYLLNDDGSIYERDITGSSLKECIIKRVIAEPGQTIDIDAENGKVIVDGKVLDEPYIKETVDSDGGMFDFPITVPDGYYFVMGDNRRNSSDSRCGDVGLIKKDQIYGKALIRYSPIKDFKFLIF